MTVSLSGHAAPLLFGGKKRQSSTKRPLGTENKTIPNTKVVDRSSQKLHSEPAAETVDLMLRDQLQNELDYAGVQAEASITVNPSATLPPISRTSLRPNDRSAKLWTERQLLKDHMPGKTYNGLDALMDLGVEYYSRIISLIASGTSTSIPKQPRKLGRKQSVMPVEMRLWSCMPISTILLP